MPGMKDPATLAFAGNLLAKGRQGEIGFGASLGNALMGAAQSRKMQIEQQRQEQADLMAKAQQSVQLRAALGGLQEQQRQRTNQEAFVQSLPQGQRAAAAVIPDQAAQTVFGQANPDPMAQAQLDQGQQRIDMGEQQFRERLNFDKQNAAATLQAMQQKAAVSGAPKLSDITSMRKEFTAQSKNFADVRDGYKRVLAADDTSQGDVALIFGYMKLLDPGSVVRENEFATAEQTAGIPERIVNLYNRAIDGSRLGPNQRQAFADQATSLYREQFETQQEVANGFTDIAGRYGVPSEDILQAVPMPSPEELVDDTITDMAKSMGYDRSLIDQAAEEAGLTANDIIRALERKRANGA